jgi:hypothetical protein
MVEWGGHHGGWGGFGPPSCIVKKCPGMSAKQFDYRTKYLTLFQTTLQTLRSAKAMQCLL